MKAFLYALIAFIAVDANLPGADFGQRAEEDEVEFLTLAVEMCHGISVQTVKRPWTLENPVNTGELPGHTLNAGGRQHGYWTYSRVPAEVAVNSDA